MLLKKYLLGAMILLFLVVGLFSAIKTVKAENVIKIGIFGPKSIPHYPHWEAGMWTAAQMLAEQANAAGGWDIGGTKYTIQVYAADEYTHAPSNTAGIEASIDYLCKPPPDGVGVNFIIGGFRTECVEHAIDYWYERGYSETVPFFINGASTNELLSTTVAVDHNAYRHLYRVMPTNSSALFGTYVTAIKTYLASASGLLTNLFGVPIGPGGTKQVRTAIIMEDLEWTNTMWYLLVQNATTSAYYLGPNVNVTYATRLKDVYDSGYNPADVANAVTEVKNRGCNLLLHVFSGGTGRVLIEQWYAQKAPALPVGINVVSQTKSMWTTTPEGACEYESHLMALGTRTPMTPLVTQFWDDFIAWSKTHLGIDDNWPVYTAIGVGNAFITLKDAIETLDTLNIESIHNYLCPRTNPTRQLLVLTGIAKFDSIHDVYNVPYDYSAYWTVNTRSWVIQWLDARLEVVYPLKYLADMSDIPFVKVWCLPPWMYPLIEDITYDGYVGIDDIVHAAENFGAYPGHQRWDHRSDVTFDNYVGIDDIVQVAEHFGRSWTGPV